MIPRRADKGTMKEDSLARRLLLAIVSLRQPWSIKASRAMVSQPNIAGRTDSSQRMVDFTEARRLGITAGEVHRYPHRPWIPQT